MVGDQLDQEILEYVRRQGRRFGFAALHPNTIAHHFRDRGEPRRLSDLAAAAIKSVRESANLGLAPDAPAAIQPLTFFDCLPKKMRLTLRGCANLWLGAQARRPDPWEGRAACVSCLVGAAHAGVKISPVAELVEALRFVCPRCLGRAPRLINGRFCISCYNRHCEAVKGKNARGTRPALADEMHNMQVAVATADSVSVATEMDVLGGAEIVIHRARQADTVLTFGWAAKAPTAFADYAFGAAG